MSGKRAGFTAVSMPESLRDRLRGVALRVSADVGYRVSLAGLTSALLDVAEKHPAELRAALDRKGADQ